MHRITGSKFYDENESATIVTAKWLNAVQENLCKFIESTGLTIPNANDIFSEDENHKLLTQAINRIAYFKEVGPLELANTPDSVTIPHLKFDKNKTKMAIIRCTSFIEFDGMDKHKKHSWYSINLLVTFIEGKWIIGTSQPFGVSNDPASIYLTYSINESGQVSYTRLNGKYPGFKGQLYTKILEER